MDLFFLWESAAHEFEEISNGEETIAVQQFHDWLTEHQKEKTTITETKHLAAKAIAQNRRLL